MTEKSSEIPNDSSPATPATAPVSFFRLPLERISSFRVTYVAIALFLLLYIFTVKGFERGLESHFADVVASSIQIDNYFAPPVQQIKEKLDLSVQSSAWVHFWDVRVTVIVMARDGVTWLYVDGHAPPPSPELSVESLLREAQRLLPANGEVVVSVAHNTMLSNSILIVYAALLLQILFLYNRRVAQYEDVILADALESRDRAAERAEVIQDQIETVRLQLMEVVPSDDDHRNEFSNLQAERESLETQLASLINRERELRSKADRAVSLEQERHALDELLEEASTDLASKDGEIRELERNLKRATRSAGGQAGRSKETDLIARRLATLYKTVEVDDRAVADIAALPDETTRLRVEECIKRLAEDADNVSIRRKVGGLPNHLSIYELGFAGKRRVYYTKGQQRRFRVLVVGAKNTQQADLDYISRIPKSEVST